LAGTAIAGQTYKLGGTWTGTQEEQDRAAYTQSVHVDGVRGSDTVALGVHAPLPSRALVTVGSSQRWRPTDISGCTLWVEGDRGLWKNGSLEELGMGHGLYEDEEVTRWEDFSDAGLDLIGQGKPRLIFTGLAGTYDTVHFAVNAPDAYFDGPILPTMSETHWFFLVWFDNVTDGRYLLGSSTGGLQGALRTTGSKLQVLGAGSTWLDLINPIEPSVWLILEIIQYAGSMQGMKNGIHGGARVTLTPNYSGQNLQIGADAGLTTKDMTLYSIIVYDHVLPMDQARIPAQYLAGKGSLSLLGSHHRPVFNHADGRIKHVRVTDVVLHDDEIADLP
jgi:hypothetical protein